MSNLPSLGRLLEGVLRKENGEWVLEDGQGQVVLLDEILEPYDDQEVRLTVVSFNELDALVSLISEQES